MLKKIVVGVVLMLTVTPALAGPSREEREASRLQTVVGSTKPGAKLSYQAPVSEGVVSEPGTQKERQPAEKLACSCHHG